MCIHFSARHNSMSTGFILDKTIGINCPKRLENAKILIANTCQYCTTLFVCVLSKLRLRANSDGHGQDQDLRRTGEGRQHWEARRT